MARACARHPRVTVGIWIAVVAVCGVLAALLLQGVLTSELNFTSKPESKRGDTLLKERFPEATAPSEIVIVRSDSYTVDQPDFRQRVETIYASVMALDGDVVDHNGEDQGVTYYYFLVDQASEYTALAILLNTLADVPDIQRQFAVAALPEEQRQAVFSALNIQTVQELPPAGLIIATAQGLEAGATQLTAAAGKLVSADRDTTLLLVTMAGSLNDATHNIGRLREVANGFTGDGFSVVVTGDASVNSDLFEVSDKDLKEAEITGIPVALIVLAIVFGTIAAAMVPLLLGLAAIIAALGITALIGQGFDLIFFVENIITMLGLGVGIDYSLFIVSRYREERREGHAKIEAIATAGSTASRAVLFSGMTVILAILGILLVPTNFHQSLAVGAVVVVAMTVLAALTLLPAVLSLIGERIDSLRVPFLKKESAKGRRNDRKGFWDWITRRVMDHPVISLVLAAGLLLACAYPALDLKTGDSGVGSLPKGYEAKDGLDVLGQEFSAGLLAPVRIVVDNYDDQQVQQATQVLQGTLALDTEDFESSQLQVNPAGDLALMTVILAGDPYSPEATELVDALRQEQIPQAFAGVETDVLVTGWPAANSDFSATISHYTPIIFGVVLGLSFILLLMVFRSIVVPLKAVIMNLLSVGAAWGLIVLVFQKGVGADLFGFQQTESIETWIPVFLFCVLFGLSMDYHVFLLSRIREHYDRTDNNTEAVAFGIRTTAGLITGAALIMVAVFGSFALGQFVVMQELGFGLAVAVLMDATIVRVFLVPSTMRLLGRANWYFPSWLRWVPDVRVETGPD
jgi:RND superfamily putative drug exporter